MLIATITSPACSASGVNLLLSIASSNSGSSFSLRTSSALDIACSNNVLLGASGTALGGTLASEPTILFAELLSNIATSSAGASIFPVSLGS